MRQILILVLISTAACSVFKRQPEDPAPAGGVPVLVRLFDAALDAYPKPDTTNLVFTTSIYNREVMEATERLAELRSARFVAVPRVCGCVDPYVGPTRVPQDVTADECAWVGELRANETQVNINVAADTADGRKIVGMHWQAFTAGQRSGAVCSYARQWSVELQLVAGVWRPRSKQCWLAAGQLEGLTVNPRGSGCGGWIMKRPGGG